MTPRPRPNTDVRRVVVVGAGGNIGSQLVPHLARMRGVDGITLIDSEVYERKNIATQNIAAADAGLPKVEAQRRRILAIAPDKDVAAIHDEVERVPVALLRANVILACLDSRRARQYVNWAACRLGVPWIDAGVQADGLLARVSVFLPGPGAPCLECAWSQDDYRLLEQRYPCGGAASPYATNAPPHLGSFAASIQANECEKLIEGRWNRLCRNQEILIDGVRYRSYVTSLRPNPECRFDHRPWTLDCLDGAPDALTLDDVYRWAAPKFSPRSTEISLRVENVGFVTELACMRGCSNRSIPLRLATRIPNDQRRCAICADVMQPVGLRVQDAVPLHADTPARAISLASLGFQPGDVLRLVSGQSTFDVQLSGPAERHPSETFREHPVSPPGVRHAP